MIYLLIYIDIVSYYLLKKNINKILYIIKYKNIVREYNKKYICF
jgi:hypothetical protein